MFVPSIPEVSAGTSHHRAAAASCGALPSPQLRLTIPCATVVYSGSGVYITYTMRVRDDVHDIVWQTACRYSAFRQLHSTAGKHILGSKPPFPSMMLTSRANRDKTEIELRRRRLETYMIALLDTLFTQSDARAVSFQRVLKVLKFLEFPFIDEWTGGGLLGARDGDAGSVASDQTRSSTGGDRISILEQDTYRTTVSPPPSVVTTRWKAPRVLPGKSLGLALPFVSLTQDVDGVWDVTVRADRSMKKGFLRHRYDEAVAMCERTSQLQCVMDSEEAQQFLTEFRTLHPVAAYLTVEKSIECNSPTSASRVDRSSSCPVSGHDEGAHDEEVVGSPVVHHHRDLVDAWAPGDAARQLFPSSHGIDEAQFPLACGAHYALSPDRVNSCRTSNTIAYVEAVRSARVDGCRCTRTSFCSTNVGDVYTTVSGFAIVVCPPP